jgi:hypothetical protein
VSNPEPTIMVPGPVATRSTHQFEVWETMAAMVELRPDVHNEPRSGAWWQQQSWQMMFEKPHDTETQRLRQRCRRRKRLAKTLRPSQPVNTARTMQE